MDRQHHCIASLAEVIIISSVLCVLYSFLVALHSCLQVNKATWCISVFI